MLQSGCRYSLKKEDMLFSVSHELEDGRRVILAPELHDCCLLGPSSPDKIRNRLERNTLYVQYKQTNTYISVYIYVYVCICMYIRYIIYTYMYRERERVREREREKKKKEQSTRAKLLGLPRLPSWVSSRDPVNPALDTMQPPHQDHRVDRSPLFRRPLRPYPHSLIRSMIALHTVQ